MNQASFHCPQCQQMRLFQSKPMNHVAHILATVFLCGLWLPVWIILSLSETPQWHCAFCGFYDQQKYLANPGLRAAEQAQSYQRQQFAEQTRAERGNDQTFGERLTYFIADNKQSLIVIGVVAGVLGIVIIAATAYDNDRRSKMDAWRASQTPTPTVTPRTPTPSPSPKRKAR